MRTNTIEKFYILILIFVSVSAVLFSQDKKQGKQADKPLFHDPVLMVLPIRQLSGTGKKKNGSCSIPTVVQMYRDWMV
jgi:hypothetical protein